MREIKFDAFILIKHPEEDEAHFEHLPFNELLHESFILFKNGILTTDKEDDEHKVILREFTGLKDKNGKEIYEGDIVKFSTRSQSANFKGQVFWPEDYAGFCVKVNNDTYLDAIKWLHDIEVIGNIYENPELLKS